ncbi:unnamed protein product [Nippostrongylus brasiliensis]|uniref:Poly(U)-binding-splicing factor PUF60 (inferred by orthology to a human protein) n=1 Tax=Nippostrongylus brasiliensis TaxID=27835 RepID=A0A0N4Y8T4_NIPBR|nr:unnamed protein product [Nippostrongylus brasiliensis]
MVELPPSASPAQPAAVPPPAAPTAPSGNAEVFVAMPVLQQHGEVFVGPGSKREAQMLGLGLTKLSSRRKDDLHLAKRYAMDVSIKQIMLRQQKAHHENQQKQAMYAQALSLMARVYIGSISFEVREEMIKKAFEVYGPIKSINMSWDPTTGHHKGFAFLEFDVPEAALLAQESMNGQLMGGRNLKVGRPSNMPQAQPIIEMVQQDAKKYHRVYVSSVHPDLSESDLKSVFEAFGEVVKCQLARQSATGKGSHRGFGYIEFNNAAAMNEAIAGMNMFDLGGQFLRVGRCITPPEALTYLSPQTQTALPTAAAQAAAAVTAKVMAAEASGPPPITQVPPVTAYPTGYGVPPPPPSNGYPVAPPLSVPPVPPPSVHRGFGGFVQPPAPVQGVPPPGTLPAAVPPPSQITPMMPPPPPPAQPAAPKGERSFEEKMERILERTKAKQDAKLSQPVTFGALDPLFAPKDPLAGSDEQSGDMLAITGKSNQDVQSMALALIGDNAVALKGQKVPGQPDPNEPQKKKKRVVEAKKIQPKLNTAQALAAAAKAGELSDAVINEQMNSEDATLASQEGLAIRGNDARHLLMAKLMRTNRSTVLVLRNMVNPQDIDEYLEEEIKEECSKYGEVQEVVIANDQSAGVVKIFVRFSDPKQVDTARAALDKRFFSGNTVSAEIYDQAMFDHNDLSG